MPEASGIPIWSARNTLQDRRRSHHCGWGDRQSSTGGRPRGRATSTRLPSVSTAAWCCPPRAACSAAGVSARCALSPRIDDRRHTMTGETARTTAAPAAESIIPTGSGEQLSISAEMMPRNTGATVREIAEDDGRHLLYEPEHELLLLINSSGRAILDLCDGKRTVGAITQGIQDRYEAGENMDVRAEVLRYLRILWSTGIVTMIEVQP